MNGLGGDDDVAMTKDNGLIVSVSHRTFTQQRHSFYSYPATWRIRGRQSLQLLIDLMAQNKLNVQVGYVLPFT